IEIDRHDLTNLLQRKPLAGLDMLTTVGRHFQAAQELVRSRAARNPNEVIAERLTLGDRLADAVARFGGSWAFIMSFCAVLLVWVNLMLASRAWDPYPFILLNLVLSMLAAVQAPIIMMSQNRQDAKDRLRSELDFAVNRKAEGEIIQLAARLNRLEDRLDDIHHDVNELRPRGGSERRERAQEESRRGQRICDTRLAPAGHRAHRRSRGSGPVPVLAGSPACRGRARDGRRAVEPGHARGPGPREGPRGPRRDPEAERGAVAGVRGGACVRQSRAPAAARRLS